ncbi:MAG: nanoRNase/pAp phosphatase (c-di-AMP/oligoRNAs hydrolase) [Halobacteriales archaeon]|jgi:nanoRNase/pAp phosphatase (c-di-AMP/oligoRNAs hydrolase)
MNSRLALGCGSVGYRVVERWAAENDDLVVVCENASRVEDLRDEKVDAREGDPADPNVIRDLEVDPDTVFVGTDDSARNGAIAETVRGTFPAALLVAYEGIAAGETSRESLRETADRTIDPVDTLVETVIERSCSRSTELARGLRGALARIDGPLAVVMHDNPDPDAIASAVALARIADAVGVEAEPCYYGDISHQENQALVNLLSLDLTNLEPDADLSGYAGFALVDHSRPGINDGLPEDLQVDIVIDHHPPRAPVEAEFADLRSDAGATSTVLIDHLDRFDVDLDETIATALLYGIRVDTDDYTREVSSADFEAAAKLLPHADTGVLERVEQPNVSGETMTVIARAIRNRERHGTALVTSAGRIADRDALAQAADRLVNLEGITTVFVYGIMDGTVFASARSRSADLDLGETVRVAFDPIGSAGGHADMAGAQIPLGVIGHPMEDEDAEVDVDVDGIIWDLMTERFLEALREELIDPGALVTEPTELVGTSGDADET